MELTGIGTDGANSIRVAKEMVQWRAFVNMVMNLRGPWRKQDIFLTSSVTISFSN